MELCYKILPITEAKIIDPIQISSSLWSNETEKYKNILIAKLDCVNFYDVLPFWVWLLSASPSSCLVCRTWIAWNILTFSDNPVTFCFPGLISELTANSSSSSSSSINRSNWVSDSASLRLRRTLPFRLRQLQDCVCH